MTVDEFLEWVKTQPSTARYELADGIPVAMAPERVSHGRTKYNVAKALDKAISDKALPCEMLIDSVGVQIGEACSYQPDVLVHCDQEHVGGDDLYIAQPIIIVEVASPSTAGFDSRTKLIDYFRLPSLEHYLIVDFSKRVLIHHKKRDDGKILTSLISQGVVTFDPPGISIAFGDIFPDLTYSFCSQPESMAISIKLPSQPRIIWLHITNQVKWS